MSAATDDPQLAGRVRSGAVWSGARTLVMRLANIAVMAVVARLLTPEAFGVFAVAITVHTVVSSIGDIGVGSMLARGSISLDEYAPTVATVSLVSSLVLGSLMFAFATPLATVLGSAAAAGPMRVMALAVLLVGVFAVPGAQLVREFRQDKQFLATIISFVPGNLSLLLMAWLGMGAMAFAWSRVIGQLVMGLAMTAMVSRNYWPGFRRSTLRPLLVFGLPLAGANLLNYTLLNTDYVFVGRALGSQRLGIYLLAFNIASWSTSLLSGMINGVAMPAFSRFKDEPERLREVLVKAVRAVALLAMPITTMTFVLADPLVATVYGQKWLSAAPVLSVLTAYGAVSVLCLLLANVLVGLGRPRLLLYVQVVWLAVLVPAMSVGVDRYGVLGAGYAHIAVIGFLVGPFYLVMVRRSTGVSVLSLLLAILPSLLAALVAAAAASAVVRLLGPTPLRLLAGAAVGGLVYAALAAPQFSRLSVRSAGPLTPILLTYNGFGERMTTWLPSRAVAREQDLEPPQVDSGQFDITVEIAVPDPSRVPQRRFSVAGRLTATLSRGGRIAAARALPSDIRPTVTVVVPCYRYGHYLPDCTRSILTQPGVDVDVIIVDDASPDGSGDVAEALAADDSRIRVIRHARNRGHIQTYNDGLLEAKGDYVVLLSADDMLAPGALARAVAVMESEPSVGLVYGNPEVFTDEASPQVHLGVRDWTVWAGQDWIAAQSRRGMSCIYSPEAVLRNSVQQQIGGYNPALPHSGDLEMWLRAAAVADVARVNGPVQALRREHPASMMHTTFAAAVDDLRERLRAYDSFFAGVGTELRTAARSSSAARRRLAREAVELASHHLGSGAAAVEVAQYLEFAVQTDPGVRTSWQWREHQARLRPARGAVARARLRGWAARRDLESRIRWQRWHWSGT